MLARLCRSASSRLFDGRTATVSGTTGSDADVAQVFVRLDGTAPQRSVATGTETWSATFEDLPDNQRYQPVARVELSDGSGRSAVGPLFTLGNPTITVSATFNEHIVAGRIAMQRPPCSAGFGVCDADFNALFFQFGLNLFALHAAAASGPWFVDRPTSPAPDQRTCYRPPERSRAPAAFFQLPASPNRRLGCSRRSA